MFKKWTEIVDGVVKNLQDWMKIHPDKFVDTITLLYAFRNLVKDPKGKYRAYLRGDPEWIWDLMIAEIDPDRENEYGSYKRPILILESEWYPNIHSICNDFAKLLEGKCKWKVMSFRTNESKQLNLKDIRKTINSIIDGYKMLGKEEEYILLCWDNKNYKLRCLWRKPKIHKDFKEAPSIAYDKLGIRGKWSSP